MDKIVVKQVVNSKMLTDFVKFPLQLYKDSPYFVPSFFNDEINIWNQEKNPALEYSESIQYLAYKNNEIVGRIAVIINHKEEKELGIKKVRFGWIDFIDDKEVSKALIQKAIDFAKTKNIETVEGPMGFTNLDKAGMLTLGFDELATMIGIYNFDYYPKHLEVLEFEKAKEWVEFEIKFPETLPEKITKFNALISEKYHLKVLKFKTKDEILNYSEEMFDLLDETYKHLSTYTPLTQEQRTTYREKYFPLLNKDFIVCITNEENKLISFAITMPSYSTALRKSKGKLFPFGWWHLLQAGRKNERANFYLIGIHPEYQRRGVTSIIFKEIFDRFKSKGVKFLETNPELEENKSIQLLWQDYNPRNHKKRKTYDISVNNWKN